MTDVASYTRPRTIASPSELRDLLSELRKAIHDGALTQVTQPDLPFATRADFLSIPITGPWPDYLELYFRDVCTGTLFCLSVETFHGAGGRWEQIN